MGCCFLAGFRGTQAEVLKKEEGRGGRGEGEKEEACGSKENDMTL